MKTNPVLIRPANKNDLESLLQFANEALYGLTSLPQDKDLLYKKICHSESSFAKNTDCRENESYLFVLEDLRSRKVLGTSGIIARIGMNYPEFSFKIRSLQHSCPSLQIYKEHKLLYLHENLQGPTEICSLFLTPDARGQGLAKLLSFSRFLFIKSHMPRFCNTITAKIRGQISKEGYSPFFEHVIFPFLGITFAKADHLRFSREDFINDLIPKEPIYIDLLPKSVQDTIGSVHPDTVPALKLLTHQGFRFFDEIDIFDAGPCIYAPVEDILTAKQAQKAILESILKEAAPEAGLHAIICNPKIQFRATYGTLHFDSFGGLALEEETVEALELELGSAVIYMSTGNS